MRSRIPAIAYKETIHIIRDWRTLALAFILPMVMNLLFSYGIKFDIKYILLAVADEDNTKLSRLLVDKFTSSGYFKLVDLKYNTEEISHLLDYGKAQVLLTIPEGFSKNIHRQEGAEIQAIFDGSENTSGSIASSYIDMILSDLSLDNVKDIFLKYGIQLKNIPPINPEVRVWFNPELKSTNTIIPGLISVVMMVVLGLLTSMTIVRERENGNLESFLSTPVRKYEILIGKITPYLIIALIDCFLILLTGVLIFDVPFRGNFLLFTLSTFLFCVVGLSFGIFVSSISNTQLLAFQIIVLSTMLPSILLSGFLFPIKSMPGWVQVITYLFPARYFISICRGIMLKGQSFDYLITPILLLSLFGFIFTILALVSFKKKI